MNEKPGGGGRAARGSGASHQAQARRKKKRLPMVFPGSIFWEDEAGKIQSKSLILLVPGERIELPTNGLQNRCSTAELTRHYR